MNLQDLIAEAGPYRRTLLLSGSLLIVDGGLSLLMPWLGGQLAQGILEGNPTPRVLLELFFLTAIQATLKFKNSHLTGHLYARIQADLRIRVHDHLQRLPLQFYHSRDKGEMLTLVANDIDQLSTFIPGALLSTVPLAVTALCAITMMLRVDFTLGVLLVLLIPLFCIAVKLIARQLRPIAYQLQRAEAVAMSILDQNLRMLPSIKAFNRQELESSRYSRSVDEVRQLIVKRHMAYAVLEPTVQFIAACCVIALLWLASARITGGQLSPAQLVSFLLYALVLTRPLSALANVYGQTRITMVALERMNHVLREPAEEDGHEGNDLTNVAGSIGFCDVSFAYPDRPPLFVNLNFTVAAGEVVAVTGENGTGKSTLALLLMRFHAPQTGRIFIDGTDISTVSAHSLRANVGLVSQDVSLFSGTVAENIRYGAPHASQADVERVARDALAEGFILALPKGYDTTVGEDGVRLSGGQRQRLALARALLTNAPIFLLDEATSMFDMEAEELFVENCMRVLKGKTVILISHRLETLAIADRVVRLGRRGTSNSIEPDYSFSDLKAS